MHSQNTLIDSLKTELSLHKKKDTIRVNLLNELAHKYYKKDISKSLAYIGESDSLAEVIGFKKGKARGVLLRGAVQLVSSNFDKSIEQFSLAKRLYEEIDDKKGIANCHQGLGVVLDYQGEYEQSIEHLKRSIQIYEEIGDTDKIPNNLTNIGSAYSNMGNNAEAMIYFKKALSQYPETGSEGSKANCLNSIAAVYEEQGNYPLALEYNNKSIFLAEEIGDSLGISRSLNNIGIIYEKQLNYDKALDYMNRSLVLQQKFGNRRTLSQIKSNIAIIYSEQDRVDEAIKLLEECIEISTEVGNMGHVVHCLINLGTIHFDEKRYALALKYYTEATSIGEDVDFRLGLGESYLGLARVYIEQNKYKQALAFIFKSMQCATELGLIGLKRDAHSVLAEIYEKTGRFEKALKSHQKYKMLEDSIYSKENFEKITQLEYEYKYKRELDAAKNKASELTSTVATTTQHLEKSQRKYLIAIIGILLLSIISGAIIAFLKLRQIKAENQNMLIEQKLLRSQMTPHFIFNSLSVLQGMILNKEQNNSILYLSKFSKLLRTILENSRHKKVSLSKEISAINSYMTLQNLHANPPFIYELTVDPAINTEHIKIPPMLIQPFIENAIEHAFTDKKENKEIKVQLTSKEKQLVCTIADNGIGIDSENIKSNKNKKSLATTITSERLAMLSKDFNMGGNVCIENRASFGEKGTLVTLIIPFKMDIS